MKAPSRRRGRDYSTSASGSGSTAGSRNRPCRCGRGDSGRRSSAPMSTSVSASAAPVPGGGGLARRTIRRRVSCTWRSSPARQHRRDHAGPRATGTVADCSRDCMCSGVRQDRIRRRARTGTTRLAGRYTSSRRAVAHWCRPCRELRPCRLSLMCQAHRATRGLPSPLRLRVALPCRGRRLRTYREYPSGLSALLVRSVRRDL